MNPRLIQTTLTICAATAILMAPSADGSIILPVDADARVGQGPNANTTFGTTDEERLIARRPTNTFLGNSDKVWIRFDLSGITPGTVTDADLDLTLVNTSGAFAVLDYEVYGLNDASAGDLAGGWDETTITGANAPGNVPSSTFEVDGAQTTLLGTFTKPNFGGGSNQPGQSIGLSGDESSAIVSFLNADTNGLATLIIVRTTGSDQAPAFASSENANFDGPELSVVVPEPGSLGLAAIGAVFMCRRRGFSGKSAS